MQRLVHVACSSGCVIMRRCSKGSGRRGAVEGQHKSSPSCSNLSLRAAAHAAPRSASHPLHASDTAHAPAKCSRKRSWMALSRDVDTVDVSVRTAEAMAQGATDRLPGCGTVK